MVRKTPRRLKKTNKLWLFCEGKTEKQYFQDLKNDRRARLKVIPKEAGVSRADQILNKALNFSKGRVKIDNDKFDKDRDMIACVFDKDDNNTKEVFEYLRAKSAAIKLIYSNPCFEYWILCHDGYYCSPTCDQKEIRKLVKSKMKIDPKKEKKLYGKIQDKIEEAKKNAKKIRKVHEKKGIELISRDSTPLTFVYQVIEIIDDFK